MDLVKQIDQDMIDAMKKQEKVRLTVIREIKAGMKQANIDAKKEINDELAIEVVSRGIKTRKESIKEFEKGNRNDLIEKTEEEIGYLTVYLPKQLEESELAEIIENAFNEIKPEGPKDMGKLMGYVTPLVKGKADMTVVSQMIKSRLGN